MSALATASPPSRSGLIPGHKYYELTNHLGNVLVTITDQKIPRDTDANDTIDYYLPRVAGVWDYYPFGMQMAGRSAYGNGYRYGFQWQEKDDELYGNGNSYTARFWQYDSRLGRRWNVDPKPNICISQYVTFANNPILFIDILGDTTIFFDKRGRYLGTINDDLENQIHFISRKSYKEANKQFNKQMDQLNDLYPNYNYLNNFSNIARSKSMAYIDNATIVQLQQFYTASSEENLERIGILIIGDSR